MTPWLKSALVLIGVFSFGGVAGAAGMRAYSIQEARTAMDKPPSEARAKFRLEAMHRHLDLTDDQMKKLEVILQASEAKREETMGPCRGGLDSLREKTDAEILEVLTPDQQERYRELAERRRKGRGKRGGP
jgi:Spy/CpxP family protein refolding chaperone